MQKIQILKVAILILCFSILVLAGNMSAMDIFAANSFQGSQTSVQPSIMLTATATYIPLASVTLVFPKLTATEGLFMIEHSENQVPPKSVSDHNTNSLLRFIPIVAILIIWLLIGVWFLILQYLLKK